MSALLPEAFSFACSSDLDSIWKKLQTIGSFEWKGADSDTYGSYLIGDPVSPDWPLTLRLFVDTSGYVLDMGYSYWRLKEGKSADDAIAFVKEKLLPALDAKDIKEAPAYR
jgi:hypothetical protein